ncbi:cytochrome c oxidase subunit 7B2, mitochondrial-like [Saccopteryx bilineata]|uniref:cytochrome c oxidase subunit 7B2, mitochondrial-like n=1 Tax=Saccopteryx bilineata TaxID=59482 RepID=UPI0033902E65
MIFPLARNILRSLKFRSIQQIWVRESHRKQSPDFHNKYGNAVLASGTTYCAVAWIFTTTQIGIDWNLYPASRVTPKE